MIIKEDILKKCRLFSELRPLIPMIAPRDFTEIDLEAIDFMIESFISLKETISTISETHLIKLHLWLTSTKDKD